MIKAISMGSIPLVVTLVCIFGLAVCVGRTIPQQKTSTPPNPVVVKAKAKAKLYIQQCDDGYRASCILLENYCDLISYHTKGKAQSCSELLE